MIIDCSGLIKTRFKKIYGNINVLFDKTGAKTMIQCQDCEFYENDDTGRRIFKCDPFLNIKEPECIHKW